jgi:hypothetical protein
MAAGYLAGSDSHSGHRPRPTAADLVMITRLG